MRMDKQNPFCDEHSTNTDEPPGDTMEQGAQGTRADMHITEREPAAQRHRPELTAAAGRGRERGEAPAHPRPQPALVKRTARGGRPAHSASRFACVVRSVSRRIGGEHIPLRKSDCFDTQCIAAAAGRHGCKRPCHVERGHSDCRARCRCQPHVSTWTSRFTYLPGAGFSHLSLHSSKAFCVSLGDWNWALPQGFPEQARSRRISIH